MNTRPKTKAELTPTPIRARIMTPVQTAVRRPAGLEVYECSLDELKALAADVPWVHPHSGEVAQKLGNFTTGQFIRLPTSIVQHTPRGQISAVAYSFAGITKGFEIRFVPDMRALVRFELTLAFAAAEGPVAYPTVLAPTAGVALRLGVAFEGAFSEGFISPDASLCWRQGQPTIIPVPDANQKAA
jgi:hypothetical protein